MVIKIKKVQKTIKNWLNKNIYVRIKSRKQKGFSLREKKTWNCR